MEEIEVEYKGRVRKFKYKKSDDKTRFVSIFQLKKTNNYSNKLEYWNSYTSSDFRTNEHSNVIDYWCDLDDYVKMDFGDIKIIKCLNIDNSYNFNRKALESIRKFMNNIDNEEMKDAICLNILSTNEINNINNKIRKYIRKEVNKLESSRLNAVKNIDNERLNIYDELNKLWNSGIQYKIKDLSRYRLVNYSNILDDYDDIHKWLIVIFFQALKTTLNDFNFHCKDMYNKNKMTRNQLLDYILHNCDPKPYYNFRDKYNEWKYEKRRNKV